MSNKLSGLKVVDCSTIRAGLRSSGMLADYGAHVVWVEPIDGDPLRLHHAIEYSVYNRGKSSVALDVESADGRAALLRLIADADVFIHSWDQEFIQRLGLDFRTLSTENPGLIYASLSGFGLEGPNRNLPAYESLVHAVVGTTGEQVGYRPAPIYEGLPFATIGAAYLLALGILAATYRKRIDGQARHVETSLADGALAYLTMMWRDSDATGDRRHDPGSRRLANRAVECGDGEYMMYHTGAVGAFGRLMQVTGFSEYFDDPGPRPEMSIPLTPEQDEIVNHKLIELFKTRPRHEWVAELLKADVCVVEILHPGEVFDTPQIAHNKMVISVEDPVLGRLEQVAPALRFRDDVAWDIAPAPRVGEHVLPLAGDDATAPALRSQMAVSDGPLLDGVRILDLGAYYAGPYASRLLADLGAEVIKLEPPHGDQLRGLPQVFSSAQAGKSSIALDMKTPEGRKIGAQLAASVDIVQHNMRPGVAEKLGLGFDDVSASNPSVIYAYSPGWGSSGPFMNRQSFAPLVSGYVGVNYEVAGQYNAPLYPVGNEDPGNGLLGALGMLISLLQRQATGKGAYFEHPQINATMTHVAHIVRDANGNVLGAERLDSLQMGIGALDRLYQSSDGWISLAVETDDEIRALEKFTGVDILGIEKFATYAGRLDSFYELSQPLADFFATKTSVQIVSGLQEHGVWAVEPISAPNCASFMREPANIASGRVAEVLDTDGVTYREIAQLIRVTNAAEVPHKLAPKLGEQSSSILDGLGYSSIVIDEFLQNGVIVQPA